MSRDYKFYFDADYGFYYAPEGLYEVEEAEGAPGLRGPAASASSCSHTIRDLLAICRHCQTALVIEENWDGVR